MNCPNCGASPEAAGLSGDRIERWHCPACNLDYEIDWSPAYEVPGVEEQTAKWWLISEEDVQALREIMIGDGQSRAALYILETGLHETDAVPADFAPTDEESEDAGD